MKKILLIAFVLITSLQSFAGWKNAMLRLRHEMGRSISVSIDGRKFDKIGRSITVGDLTPGVHRLKIYKYNSNGYGYSNGILIYQGSINVRPGRIYYGTVTYNGLDIEENCCIDDYGHWNNNDNWDHDDELVHTNQSNSHYESHGEHGNHQGNGHNNHGNNGNENGGWNNGNHNGDQGGDNWNNNNQWNQQHSGDNYGENSWGSYNGQMSEGRFNELIGQIKKASFETSKESVAKQALKTNKISCNQLLRILNEFSFESTKLQIAKDAYKSVTDRNNYYLINDAFTFQSSKDELLEFLDRMVK